MNQELINATITTWVTEKNIPALCEALFQFTPTPTQCKIIRAIAYAEHKRVVISCMTRYGKTLCVAAGTLLYAIMHSNKRILLVSPLYDQTAIIRNYIGNFIMNSPVFQTMLEQTSDSRVKREMSRKRLVLKNNTELTALSAEGTGDRLMGHGGDMVILDESCQIVHDVYLSKIARMLGDSPDSILIEIGNPWHRDNQMWDHWCNPEYKKIHVGWKTALAEKRITQEFLDERKAELSPIEWEVQYESNFPEESEDALFRYSWVQAAILKWKDFKEWDDYIIGIDVADKGKDRTVIMQAKVYDGNYLITDIYSEAKSESTQIANRVEKIRAEQSATKINIDCIGVGVGIYLFSFFYYLHLKTNTLTKIPIRNK